MGESSIVLPAKATVALSDSIQPRNEGAFWIYTSVYFEDGKSVSNGTSKEEIVKIKDLQGRTCYQVKLTMDWRSLFDRLAGAKLTEGDYDYFWEYLDEQGSYNFSDWDGDRPLDPATLEDFELTLPYPVKTGAKYQAEGSVWEVLDAAKKLKVSAGTFSCVVYQSLYAPEGSADEDKIRDRYYMSKGVGLVRYEMDVFIDGKWVLDIRDDLVKYDLNDAQDGAIVESSDTE